MRSAKKYSTVALSRSFKSAWKMTEIEILDYIEKAPAAFRSIGEDADVRIVEAFLLHGYLNKNITHYFCEEGLFEFCKSSVRRLNPENCVEFPLPEKPDHCGYPLKNRCRFTVADKEKGGYLVLGNAYPPVIAVHFPIKERHHSIIFSPNFSLIKGNHVASTWFAVARDNEDIALLSKNSDSLLGSDCSEIARFIFGFSLYLHSFPNFVKEAYVQDIKRFEAFSGKKYKILKSHEAQEDFKNSVSAHWRRGHFRLLSSNRFKASQGKVVFVRGTFVKGKAYDAENPNKGCYA